MKIGPFIKSKNKTSKMMMHVIVALLPIILFGFYKNGILPYVHGKTDIIGMLYPLVFVILGGVFTYFIEKFFARFFLKKKDSELKEYMRSSFSILPGIFLSLILPVNTPIWVLFFGAFVSIALGKIVYGGFGNNIFNPALLGRLFVITIYAGVITNAGGYLNAYEVDTISSATPLSNVASVEGIGTYETLVSPYGTLMDFFIGFIPGTIGETSALLCLVAFIYLSITKTIKRKIPMIYVGTVFVITWIIGRMNGLDIWYPLFQVLSGGLLFGAVFMATDPVTSPTTPIGQVLYSISLGILTVVFRYMTPAPEGVLTSILTMNMFVPMLDTFGSYARGKASHYSIVFIVIVLLGLGITYSIGKSYQTPSEGDPNFNILDKVEEDGKIIYTVTQKGNGGPIKAEVTVKDNTIIKIEILSQNETPSYYKLVEDAKYIDKLISNKNIEELDTVSGATVSSKALKKMAINVLEEAAS